MQMIELMLLIFLFLLNHEFIEGIELLFIDTEIGLWDCVHVGSHRWVLWLLEACLHLDCIAFDLVADVIEEDL